MQRFAKRFLAIVSSRVFYLAVLGAFVFQAVWMALSSVYPMAFDEDFHVGVIRIYAEQWSPFLGAQPPGADIYGSLVPDPSYLYHYLMSFPYRLLTEVTGNEAAQMLVLRGLNIIMFAVGLALFAKVLRRSGASRLLTNVCLALVVLVPIVPTLAGQINYDNLIMVLMPLLCLAGMDIIDGLKQRQVRLKAWVYFGLFAMAASLVKYAFLPIVLGAVIVLGWHVWRAYRGHWRELWSGITASFAAVGLRQKLLLGAVLLVMLMLFGQRYGTNVVQYHTPVPDCAVSLSKERCMAYGPWGRNERMAERRPDNADSSPVTFMRHWVYGMWFRLFFAVNGPDSSHQTRRPVPVASSAAFVLAFAGILAAIIFWRRVFRGRAYMGFFLSIIVVYVGVLWLEQYSQFVKTGHPVAINGRYLIPVLPLMLLIWGKALAQFFRGRLVAKAVATAGVLLIMAYGGGIATFILRSDHGWYWPNRTVQNVNDTARELLQPVIIEGRPY